MTTHDTALRFAIGTLDDAHRFESETFAQDEGDKLCQEMMEIDGMRPMIAIARQRPSGPWHCETIGSLTGTSYGYLRTTNATGRIPEEV